MRSPCAGICQVAHGAGIQLHGMHLQVGELDSILGTGAGSNRVWAVMARLTVYAAVALRQPV